MPNQRIISFIGLFILMFAGWIVSRDKRRVNIRLIATGLLLQCGFAIVVFTLPAGTQIFAGLNALQRT